jgi:Dolichyl-phosphate-mannose-protein mannosyltransferase
MNSQAFTNHFRQVPHDSISEGVSVLEHKPQESPEIFPSGTLVALPLVMGVALLATNRWFTIVDDECAIIDRAARPVRDIAQPFLRGAGMHEHPPLYDLLLHGWLRLTAGNIHLLRLPAILFYVTGAWILSLIAKRLGGVRSQFWTLIVVALSPFGFHFGRLATWYSCAFLLVSLLTFTYLRLLDQPTTKNWVAFLAACIALVYANYYGWAFLAMLAVDYAVRNRRAFSRAARGLALTGLILLVAYLPIFRAFEREVRGGTRPHFFPLGILLNIAYNIYLVFVSESVAPWFWPLTMVATVAISLCALILLQARFPAKRFLLYFFVVVAFLAALGIIMPKRTFFMTPWLLLPLGVALGTMPNRWARRALLGGLAVCVALGWYGIFSRSLYAAPHWLEPWDSVARESAKVVLQGGIVIGNNPSFFFYLSYVLPVQGVAPHAGEFPGLLPDSVRVSGVYTPPQWIEAGRPTRHTIELVEGVHYGSSADPTNGTQNWLDQHCSLQHLDRRVRDSGAGLKQRYARLFQPEWRVEVRNYACP